MHKNSMHNNHQPAYGGHAFGKYPEWSRRLREEIRQDLVEILGPDGKVGPWSTGPE